MGDEERESICLLTRTLYYVASFSRYSISEISDNDIDSSFFFQLQTTKLYFMFLSRPFGTLHHSCVDANF